MKKFMVLGFLAAFILSALGAGVSPALAQGGKGAPIRIGAFLPMSGVGYQGGLDSKVALEIAMDKVNHAGGLLGRQVEMVIRDHKGEVPLANRTAQELIDREKVRVLIGGGGSASVLAGSAVAQKGKIPFLASMGICLLAAVPALWMRKRK